MPASAGLSAETGRPLVDWDHVRQSIETILTTPIGSRVMRRDFGSEVPDLVDRPMTDTVILAVYAATANALVRWEPRFQLLGVEVIEANAEGVLSLAIIGRYLPRGHRGDFTPDKDDLVQALVGVGRRAA